MTEQQLKNHIGVYIIVANLCLVILTLAVYFAGGFLYEEMTTTIALLVPMFSIYTTAIIKFIIENRTTLKDRSRNVSTTYRLVSWLIPICFTMYLGSIIMLKALNFGFSSFEQFKGLMLISETMFGAYVGLILGAMFDIPKEGTDPAGSKKTS